MAAFSLLLNLAIEVNRHFLENEYGDLSFFSVEQETIVENVNLASNRDYNYKGLHGINKVLLLLNEHGDPSFLFQNLCSYNTNNQ